MVYQATEKFRIVLVSVMHFWNAEAMVNKRDLKYIA